MTTDSSPARLDVSEGLPLRPAPILAALEREHVDYVLIGGLAAQLHGDGHPTRGVDICPDTDPANLERLRAALVGLRAKQWVPGFGHPLQLPMERRRLDTDSPLLTQTIAGPLDVIPIPYGHPHGYHELAGRAHQRVAYGLSVQIADLADLLESARTSTRPKDAHTMLRLIRLDQRTRHLGIQPARQIDIDRPAPTTAQARLDDVDAGLIAAEHLTGVIENVRPVIQAARYELAVAVERFREAYPDEQHERLTHIQTVLHYGIVEADRLRRELHPQFSDSQLREPPVAHGVTDPAAALIYQVHDELLITCHIIDDAVDEFTAGEPVDVRDLLLEARIHLATAGAHAEHLELHLQRAARAWEIAGHPNGIEL